MNHPTIQRVRHELKLRELEVARIERLSPGFLAITFKGEALADFTSLSFDDHVKLMFDDEGAQVRRDYTPRRFSREARELTLEFALHGEGQASSWACRAVVGQRALVGGPRGSLVIPLDLDWHLLAGDASALPAIARRLEELPDGAQAQVIVLADAGDQRPCPAAPTPPSTGSWTPTTCWRCWRSSTCRPARVSPGPPAKPR